MNRVGQLLQSELNHLVDRIASATRQGMVADCLERQPELAARLGEVENELSSARQRLLQDYDSWRQALEECGDLWALIELEGEAGSPGERRTASEGWDGVPSHLVPSHFSPGMVAPVKPALGVEQHRAVKALASASRRLSTTAA
jgi:hypothetical protein